MAAQVNTTLLYSAFLYVMLSIHGPKVSSLNDTLWSGPPSGDPGYSEGNSRRQFNTVVSRDLVSHLEVFNRTTTRYSFLKLAPIALSLVSSVTKESAMEHSAERVSRDHSIALAIKRYWPRQPWRSSFNVNPQCSRNLAFSPLSKRESRIPQG